MYSGASFAEFWRRRRRVFGTSRKECAESPETVAVECVHSASSPERNLGRRDGSVRRETRVVQRSTACRDSPSTNAIGVSVAITTLGQLQYSRAPEGKRWVGSNDRFGYFDGLLSRSRPPSDYVCTGNYRQARRPARVPKGAPGRLCHHVIRLYPPRA